MNLNIRSGTVGYNEILVYDSGLVWEGTTQSIPQCQRRRVMKPICLKHWACQIVASSKHTSAREAELTCKEEMVALILTPASSAFGIRYAFR